jgi:hypothetical protein
VRRWEEMGVEFEFRCFVFQGRMTAISQYHHLCFFPCLAESSEVKEAMCARLLAYYEEHLQGPLSSKFRDFVVDLGVTTADGRVVVIELNPFLETTDSCCFSWNKERDLLEGRRAEEGEGAVVVRGCAYRVRDRPVMGSKAMIYEDWRKLLESVEEGSSPSHSC